jgi:hypothetical protein
MRMMGAIGVVIVMPTLFSCERQACHTWKDEKERFLGFFLTACWFPKHVLPISRFIESNFLIIGLLTKPINHQQPLMVVQHLDNLKRAVQVSILPL